MLKIHETPGDGFVTDSQACRHGAGGGSWAWPLCSPYMQVRDTQLSEEQPAGMALHLGILRALSRVKEYQSTGAHSTGRHVRTPAALFMAMFQKNLPVFNLFPHVTC